MQTGLQQHGRRTRASAIMHPAPHEILSDRAALAEELGYRKIGADLPDNVSLSSIIQSLPSEVTWNSLSA